MVWVVLISKYVNLSNLGWCILKGYITLFCDNEDKHYSIYKKLKKLDKKRKSVYNDFPTFERRNSMIDFEILCQEAKKVLKPRILSKHIRVGDVACALVTDQGNIYTGVCIDASCSIGFCAEHAAISAMLTHGETHIEKIVSISEHGMIYPPCGRCRELISQVDERNMETLVMIDNDKVVKLEELLPFDWKKAR